MIERKFVAKGLRNAELEDYLEKELSGADYSRAVIKRTPLSTRIMIYAGRPGMVIGRSGAKIKELTDVIATRFGISNPQIEVGNVENQYLDAVVVAKQIAYSLERGTNYRRVVNIMLKNIMDSGAIGIEICLAGKISGARKRTEKFMRGNLKKSGHSREICTDIGRTTANLRPGVIGISVRIMHSLPDVLLVEKRLKALMKEAPEEAVEEEKEAEDAEKEAAEKPSQETENEKADDSEVKKEKKKKKEPKAEPKEKAAEAQEEPADGKEEKPAKEEEAPEKADDAGAQKDEEEKQGAEKEEKNNA